METTFLPLYLRLTEQLRQDLCSAQADSQRLPTLNALQARYGASRPTISKALAALVAEGLLVKQAGRGTFALAPAPPNTAFVAAPPRPAIGFIAPLSDAELPQHAFQGIDRIAHRRNFRVLMAGARGSVIQEEAVAREMIADGAKGLIIYPAMRQGALQESDYLRRADLGVPVVLMDTCTPEQGQAQVIFDNKRAGYSMTKWLIEQGHRRIGLVFFTEETHHPSLEARYRGYREALQDYSLDYDVALVCRIKPGEMTLHLGPALAGMGTLPQPPTALLACDDTIAMTVIDLLTHNGVRVPDEICVTGFDNRIAARRFQPAFTTTKPDFELMGEIACEMLLDGIESGALPAQTYVLTVPVLVRQKLAAHRHNGELHELPVGRLKRSQIA